MACDGATNQALPLMERALANRRARGTLFVQPYYLALLAQARAKAGTSDWALRTIEEAVECVERTDERWVEPELHRLRGELLLDEFGSSVEEVEACLCRAIERAQALEVKRWELRAATALARLWAERGERQKAYDLLAPVYGWFTEGFDTRDLKDAKALLDALQ